ncbi:MAG: hypothetical protein SPF51_07075, partial [Candidatus Fimivicinus sp.]|nr:hypothetical protein [Oscillospiraceae bacterium]MDY5591292.1 hypothetical protein [Candidatus Fimivicinus sp.]
MENSYKPIAIKMNARRGVEKGRKKEKKELTKGRWFDRISKRSRESSELLKEGGLAKAKKRRKGGR